jgi:hypothetical protein
VFPETHDLGSTSLLFAMNGRGGIHNHLRLHRRSPEQLVRNWDIQLGHNMALEALVVDSGPIAIIARGPTTTSSSTAATTTCAPDDTSSFCQKPVNSSTFTLPIILGIA